MTTDTQAVKAAVRRLRRRARPSAARAWWDIAVDLQPGSVWAAWRVQSKAKRLMRRAIKKRGQPFRRQDRGPLRRRAAGKNEIRGYRR
jgi:hypothetical protein